MRKLLSIAFMLMLFACSSDDPDPEVIKKEFDEAVKALTYLDQESELTTPHELETEEEESRDGESEYECSVTRYKASPGFSELFLLDPTSDVIYPGALIKGESVTTGEYIPIIADRAPITISISLENIGGTPKADVENPTLSSVRAAIVDILNSNVNGNTPAKISFEIQEVHSSEQLKLAIGANYSNSFASVSGSFDFNKEEVRSRVIVKFLQVYYSLDIDTPRNPSDLFQAPPDLSDLGSVSPMYIATVTYGRMVLFSAESSKSTTEVKAALNAAFNAGVHEGDISISTEYQKVIEETNIKALVLGGSGSSGSKVVNGIEGLKEYISEGGDYSKDSPGAPLSYKMRYLKDNAVGKVILTTEYSLRQCSLNYPQYRFEIKSLLCSSCEDGDGSNGELYGSLYAEANYGGSVVERIDWSTGHLSLSNGGSNNINSAKIVELYKPNYELDNFKIGGSMKESDFGCPFDCDDNFGSHYNIVYLKDLTFADMEYEVNFNGAVKAYFIITRLK
jgi:thiol-activated cytolysin